MKMNIFFDMDNAAFEDDPRQETIRILKSVARKVEYVFDLQESFAYPIRDVNGNRIGTIKFDK